MLEMITGAESGKAETFVLLFFQKKVEGIGSIRPHSFKNKKSDHFYQLRFDI
jgi:hypothetical protein